MKAFVSIEKNRKKETVWWMDRQGGGYAEGGRV